MKSDLLTLCGYTRNSKFWTKTNKMYFTKNATNKNDQIPKDSCTIVQKKKF